MKNKCGRVVNDLQNSGWRLLTNGKTPEKAYFYWRLILFIQTEAMEGGKVHFRRNNNDSLSNPLAGSACFFVSLCLIKLFQPFATTGPQ
jgi:hypothetical protein